MAFAHEPLSDQELGPAVVKLVGEGAPPQMRVMVARGLAPLPPRDLVVALYHFWCINDPDHAATAGKTVEGLPEPVVAGALGDSNLPAGVLDFLGRKLMRKDALLDTLVRHPNVTNDTLAGIARLCGEQVCETLADNQARWLAHPAIAANLYQNPKCRMSVIHRVLELAEREHVDLKLPNMEEIRITMKDAGPPDPDRDDMFRRVATRNTEDDQNRAVAALSNAAAHEEPDPDALGGPDGEEPTPEELGIDLDALVAEAEGEDVELPMEDKGEDKPLEPEDGVKSIAQMKPAEKVRLALLGNAFERATLIRDSNKVVALSAIKSPRMKENEVVGFSANRSLSHDIIRYIARRRDWVKLYAIKLNLVMNPKTPMAQAMTFLGHLHPHDVRKIARSKNIPSALATAAKRKLAQRR